MNKLRSEIMISFYTTVYNNAPWIKHSLRSIISTCLKLKSKYDIESEIIVVDNYSNDGTYEKMIEVLDEFTRNGVIIKAKIIRYRCNRGLGRQIALKLSKGNYLFFITDMDLIYDDELLSDVIAWYLMNERLRKSAFYLYLMPREYAVSVGGIMNLNRTEDIEFAARIAKHYEILPVIKPFSYELLDRPFVKGGHIVKPKTNLFITTFVSERRYAKSILGYLKRELGNKIDMIRGMGYTPAKIIRELLYLRKFRGITFIISFAYHILFWLLTRMLFLPIYNHTPYVNNGSYVDYMMFTNYAKLLDEKSKSGEIKRSNARHQILKYLKRNIDLISHVSLFETEKEIKELLSAIKNLVEVE
ncbi:MAG: glycosyltransferase family 2 protein [Desulfurococcaceae archaeon]